MKTRKIIRILLLCLLTYPLYAQQTEIKVSGKVTAVNKVHTMIESESKKEEDIYIFIKTEKLLKKIYLKEILFITRHTPCNFLYAGAPFIHSKPFPHTGYRRQSVSYRRT
jgi:hypothetical protein